MSVSDSEEGALEYVWKNHENHIAKTLKKKKNTYLVLERWVSFPQGKSGRNVFQDKEMEWAKIQVREVHSRDTQGKNRR